MAALQFWPLLAVGQPIGVTGAVALDGVIKCFITHDYWVTTTTGPCNGFVPPEHVRIGETFLADGQTITINVIQANRADEDMPDLGLRTGEWSCGAAESVDDIPTATTKGKTWLFILNCKPSP